MRTQTGGEVWYLRENAQIDPDAVADRRITHILDLVVKRRLPIGLSTKLDFSDYVDEDGVPHPR